MSKRTVFTTISPLPSGVSREAVLDFLKDHLGMIDLNPLVKDRYLIQAPADADPEEVSCTWYSLTDEITYLPGGLATGDISYTCAFYDLPNGIQTHCRAPLGVDIRAKWTLNGTLPGEPLQPVELGIGAPQTGLYIREDVDLRCNLLMAGFVKKNLKKSHGVLIDRLVSKARFGSRAPSFEQRDRLSTTEKPPVRSWSPARPPPSQPLGWPPATQDAPAAQLPRKPSPPRYAQQPYAQPVRYPSPHHPPDVGNQLHLYQANGQDYAAPHQQQQGHGQYNSAPASQSSTPAPPYALPTPASRDPSLYPNPLRLRNSSASSVGSQRESMGQPSWGQNGSSISLGSHQSHHARSASAQSQPHADYPEMNPYSGGAAAEETTPQDKKAPAVFIAELGGHDPRDVIYRAGFRPDAPVEHPASLRPGHNRVTGTLNGPFVAELE